MSFAGALQQLLGELIIIYHPSSLIQISDQIKAKNEHLLTPYLYIPSRISCIDEIIGGFKANMVTYLYGTSSFIYHIPYDLCLQSYVMFQGISLFIDGGSSVNPYRLSWYAKINEIPALDLLRYVQISRAFTLHQLHSIVHDTLEPLIKKHNPQTLIVHTFPLLYLDKDIQFHEAKTLFMSTFKSIQRLTKNISLSL